MAVNKISLRIGGPAGRGIMNTGLMFAKCCSRIGLHVFDYIEYPSLVKGGHNTYLVRAEDEPVHCQIRMVDILIALDEQTVDRHRDELRPDSILIYDEKVVHDDVARQTGCHRVALPMKELLQEAHGKDLMANTVCLGAALGLMRYPLAQAEGVVRDAFGKKESAVVIENQNALRLGYDYAQQHFAGLTAYRLEPREAPKRMVLTGNEAIALGALSAGLTFYAAYPMTPASAILHTLAAWQERHGIVVKQAEDEISVANMTVGAAFAGARAMCATSGGGFALMNETLSLAGITETPAVFVEVMRAGPGTGVPTFTEQADLSFVLNSGHGDFPLFVVAPGDVEDAFYLTAEALNAAERWHTPVVILSDKYLGESHKSADFFDQHRVPIDRGPLLREAPPGYRRYPLDGRVVTPRTIPGVPKGFFLANSDEHDPYGYSTEEIDLRNAQMEKRMRKLEAFAREMPQPILRGPADAELTIIGWGSTKGPILEAMRHLVRDGLRVNYLQLTWLQPFPAATVRRILTAARRTLIVENNYSGQMERLIREQTGLTIDHHLRRYDGRPFFFEDLCAHIKSIVRGEQE